jgi:hypothetical protein
MRSKQYGLDLENKLNIYLKTEENQENNCHFKIICSQSSYTKENTILPDYEDKFVLSFFKK